MAFYAGSLEKTDGSGSGKMLHALADKRCSNFGTCLDGGGSKVNKDFLDQMNLGKQALMDGDCASVRGITDRIVQIMSIPLVQGALRYAYKVAKLAGKAKEKAEGAAFAGAILGRIGACNSGHATTINSNMKIDAGSPMGSTFPIVKQAFEACYEFLGITCADVGGLIQDGTCYYEEAGPCGGAGFDPSTCSGTSSGTSSGSSSGTDDTEAASSWIAKPSLFKGVLVLMGLHFVLLDLNL
jgi:hypothetical protein